MIKSFDADMFFFSGTSTGWKSISEIIEYLENNGDYDILKVTPDSVLAWDADEMVPLYFRDFSDEEMIEEFSEEEDHEAYDSEEV